MSNPEEKKPAPFGEDTEKFLDDAKKGKQRHFLMVCKSQKVMYLVVKKKPVKETELVQAKKSGFKGDGYFGILAGKGMELTFTLAKSEGYTDSPVKNQVLKEFLEEEVKFKCKPNIAIVDVPPIVAFDEEDLNDPLIAKFMKLELVISKALDLHPTKAEELQKSVTDIRILLQDDEKRGDADSKIQSLTIYLKELLTTKPLTTTSSPSSSSTPPLTTDSGKSTSDDETTKKHVESLKSLKGEVDRIVNVLPDLKSDLFNKLTRIANEIKSKLFDVATRSLTDFAKELELLAGEAKSPEEDDIAAELVIFRERQSELEPQLKEMRKKLPERMSEVDILWSYAGEQADSGNFNNAHKALGRLAQRMDSLKEEVDFLEAMSRTEELLGNDSEEIMQSLLDDQAKQILELLDKIVVPSARSSDLKRIQTARATVEDALGDISRSPTQIGIARSNLDSYRHVILEIREGLDREAKSILDKLKSVARPNGVLNEEWQGVEDLCESVRSLVDVEAPFSDDVDSARESVESIPAAIEVAKMLTQSRVLVETAFNEVPELLRGAVEFAIGDDATIGTYEKARTNVLNDPTNKELASELNRASNDAAIQISKIIAQVVVEKFKAASELAAKECRLSVGRIPAAIFKPFYSETLGKEQTYIDFQQHKKSEVNSGNYTTRISELESKKKSVIQSIDSLVKDYQERSKRTIDLKERYQKLVANLITEEVESVTVILENALPTIKDLETLGSALDAFAVRVDRWNQVKNGIESLRNDLATFEQKTCKLRNGEAILKMLGELEIAVSTGEPSINNVNNWEDSLRKRTETFQGGKSSVVNARKKVTSGVSYLQTSKVIVRGANIPSKKIVESYLGPATGASVDDWGYTYEELAKEIRESSKDGLMTQLQYDKAFTKKSGQQNYIIDGSLHISVVCTKVKDLWQVTGLHVSPENSTPEKGKPHYWYTVNGGKLTPQVATGDLPNPSGYDYRMPENFVTRAQDLVKAKAGRVNCRV